MNPAARLSLALVAGLVLWLPTLSATLRGDVELFEAAIRYLAGFLLARLAVGLLSGLIRAYTQGAQQDVGRTMAAGDEVEQSRASAA